MAKKQAPPERTRSRSNSKTKTKPKPKTKAKVPSPAAVAKSKSRSRNRTLANDDEESPVIAAPSSSEEPVEFTDAEEIEERSSAKGGEEEDKEPQSGKKKGKKKDVKNKSKKRGKEEDDEEDSEERGEIRPYTFPMNRVDRIIRSEIPDLKISQEAVFLINRSTEKFPPLFCREAYAGAFLDQKNYLAYNHLSSVVSKRERLKFLSDFIPGKVKAEDALAQLPEAEKHTESNLNS